ncbi:hypothetical protein [Lentzea sp. NBRC 105346]|uniref:hypothetical protein n=1 Tax=Lentzea sp. NBRC 105346 TaxID=3032205 RepID=UPI002557646C|nr:hypothetical protein [Lentzea sp. NBRC 105346]
MSNNEHASPHALSALTGAAVLFVLLRLFSVAHYDWHTAFALLHTLELDDAPGLFLGTFMADSRISGVLLMVLPPVLLFFYVRTRDDPKRARAATLLGLVVAVAMLVSHTISYHRWWLPAGAAVIAAGLLFVKKEPVHFVLRWFAWLMSGAALVVAAIVTTPWVPLERIETKTGTHEYYVMETSPGFLKVIGAQDHKFAILRADDVLSRTELVH